MARTKKQPKHVHVGLERPQRDRAVLDQDIARVNALLGIAEDDMVFGIYAKGVRTAAVPAVTLRMILERLQGPSGNAWED